MSSDFISNEPTSDNCGLLAITDPRLALDNQVLIALSLVNLGP